METKINNGHGLKSLNDKGNFTAVFATLEVIDHQGDIIKKGAITPGKTRISYWGHRWQDLPVGIGQIKIQNNEAIVEGQLFMDTQGGVETYKTLKGLGDLAEFSFGYDIVKSSPLKDGGRILEKLKVYEVSPVFKGAGINTRLTSMKGKKSNVGISPDSVIYITDIYKAIDAIEKPGLTPSEVLTNIDIDYNP